MEDYCVWLFSSESFYVGNFLMGKYTLWCLVHTLVSLECNIKFPNYPFSCYGSESEKNRQSVAARLLSLVGLSSLSLAVMRKGCTRPGI